MTNLLTVLAIVADLKALSSMKIDSKIIEEYIGWKKGYLKIVEEKKNQIFRIVQRIEIKCSNGFNTVYFSLPFLNRFPNTKF